MGKHVEYDAEEMVDVDVQFISLVSKPANKIPFRITKSQKTSNPESTKMLNFGSMLKGEAPQQEVAKEVKAFVIREADADKMAEFLKGQDVDVESGELIDGRIVYKTSEFEAEDVTAFQVSEDLVVLVSGVAKAFEPFGAEGSFTDKVKSSGVLPNLMNATDVMVDSMFSTLDSAEAPADAVEKLEAMLDEFKSFVTTSISELPASVFKIVGNIQHPEEATLEAAQQVADGIEASVAEEVVAEEPVVEAAAEEVAEEVITDPGVDNDAVEQEEVVGGAVEAPTEVSDEAEDVAKSEEKNSEEIVSESVAEEVEKQEAPDVSKLIADLSGVVTEQLKGLQKEVSSLSGRLDEVEGVAKSASESMKGTAILRSDSIDGTTQKAAKPEVDFWGGVLDDL